MFVLKATEKQYKALNGYQKGVSKLEFIKDANNVWIINLDVLDDLDFIEIQNHLKLLKQIDYEPKQVEI
jgi:hypothetical protein